MQRVKVARGVLVLNNAYLSTISVVKEHFEVHVCNAVDPMGWGSIKKKKKKLRKVSTKLWVSIDKI